MRFRRLVETKLIGCSKQKSVNFVVLSAGYLPNRQAPSLPQSSASAHLIAAQTPGADPRLGVLTSYPLGQPEGGRFESYRVLRRLD